MSASPSPPLRPASAKAEPPSGCLPGLDGVGGPDLSGGRRSDLLRWAADDRLARAAWSRLAEPGDPVAARLVAGLGAGPALEALASRRESALDRFRPRLEALDVDDEQNPTAARQHIGGVDFTTEPVAHAPVLLVSPEGKVARFSRSLCVYTRSDGARGAGWTEYNWPQ